MAAALCSWGRGNRPVRAHGSFCQPLQSFRRGLPKPARSSLSRCTGRLCRGLSRAAQGLPSRSDRHFRCIWWRNLAAAVPLKIRDLGLPLPAAVGLFTPEVDLTESGDTFNTNRDIDVVLRGGLPEMNALYANGHDLAHPICLRCSGISPRDFHPPSYKRARAMFSFPIPHDSIVHSGARSRDRVACMGGDASRWIRQCPEDQEMRVEFAHFLAKHAGWAKP